MYFKKARYCPAPSHHNLLVFFSVLSVLQSIHQHHFHLSLRSLDHLGKTLHSQYQLSPRNWETYLDKSTVSSPGAHPQNTFVSEVQRRERRDRDLLERWSRKLQVFRVRPNVSSGKVDGRSAEMTFRGFELEIDLETELFNNNTCSIRKQLFQLVVQSRSRGNLGTWQYGSARSAEPPLARS